MVVPLAARWVAAAVGIALVLTGWQSVIGTLIVPRPVGSWLTRSVDRWRVNYESTAYQIAAAIDAVPALWSGPRRHPSQPISPDRPPPGRQRMRQPPSEASSEAPIPGAPDEIYDPS
jgi:hypothetical protein